MLMDNAPDIIARFDRSLRHLYVNPAITTATGKVPEEIIGKTNEELDMPEEHLALWNTALRKVLATGESSSLEFSFPSPTGLRFYQSRLTPERDDQGEIISVLSIARDVTDLKQTQAALIQSEARARRLIDSNMIGVVIANMNGIFEANDAFLDMVGYTHEDLAARRIDWRAMTPPEYLPRDEFGLQELRECGVCTPFEKEYVRRDGSRVAILIGAATVQADPLQWVCFILDITRCQQQERRLQQALDALLTVAEVLVTRPRASTTSPSAHVSPRPHTAGRGTGGTPHALSTSRTCSLHERRAHTCGRHGEARRPAHRTGALAARP
jgi:PAS domain S-box-containing protein